ncbi:ABC transporter ATP-binding protein [uncultured Paracoccus sp.]|uniref:ABC transporter ATP-binding protein n=1 Tax=uncultured Paracoccus sp. TaxID=189685 RepID=UPI002638C769|nr:ABC transporter ATP-binding protein [uncultured Paracoccus sp.]
MSRLLEIAGLQAGYGAVQALFDVDLTVDQGEVVALMGRNGMGKTTTIRTLCRLLPIRSGTIRFAGTDLGPLPAHRAARLGLGLVPEGRRCFAPLTVAENLIVAARPGPWDRDRVEALFPRLAERRRQPAATLSGGEQQMLAIGRALMTNPRLLILDEATEGLAPVVRQEIWSAIAALKGQGLSILLVDKSLREIRAVADRAVVLERGCSIWSGRPASLTAEEADRYLGV